MHSGYLVLGSCYVLMGILMEEELSEYMVFLILTRVNIYFIFHYMCVYVCVSVCVCMCVHLSTDPLEVEG